MRILENDGYLQSVSVDSSLPSVNERRDVDDVLERIKTDPEQHSIISRIESGVL